MKNLSKEQKILKLGIQNLQKEIIYGIIVFVHLKNSILKKECEIYFKQKT